jgi:hypothetical protein
MPLLEEGEIWQATVACTAPLNQQIGLNRYLFYVDANAGIGGTDAQLALALDTVLAPLYKVCLANVASYYGVKVHRYLLPPVNRPVISTAFTGVGTGGANMLPSAMCGLLKLTSTQNGRKGQGRTYIPFISDSYATDAGEPTGAFPAFVTAIGTALLGLPAVGAGGNLSTVQLCLPNQKFNTATGLVIHATGEPKFATQHRRGDFGQLNAIPPF